MARMDTVSDIYAAVDELIAELRTTKEPKLSRILFHRLHEVAWTTGSELLDELRKVLTEALHTDTTELSPSARKAIESILTAMKKYD
jgi:hypothetical protein